MRTERDALGEMRVPKDAHYGAHTARSIENFMLAGEPMPIEIVHAMARIKWACARANAELGDLAPDIERAIVGACERVLTGELDDHFPLDVFQAGSGTSSNMNVNEVLARLAGQALAQPVHPNDHVNRGQSTNNVFPSAIKMATLERLEAFDRVLGALIDALTERARAFADVLKSGRTHLQDAVPMTLGQAFAAYAHALERDRARLRRTADGLHELGIGGNAIGTGVNTRATFRPTVMRWLNALTGGRFRLAENGVAITQFLTDLADVSSALALTAIDVQKICNDLRLLASGPHTGLGELILPAVEPGSSIMPGKINPSICEAVNMVCMQAQANDVAVRLACGAGQLELNTHMPLIGLHLVKTPRLMERAFRTLTDKCIRGLEADRARCRAHFERSAGLPTVLNPALGYDRVAELVKTARSTGQTLRELVLERNLMTEAELDALLERSTGPTDSNAGARA